MSDFHNIQSHGEQSSRHSAVPPINTGSTEARVFDMIRKGNAAATIERVKRNARPIQKHRKLNRKAPEPNRLNRQAVYHKKATPTAKDAPLANSTLAELKKLLAIEQR